MEEILNNLKDPSWWFTAFFIAIVASIAAGFLKDKIEQKIGGLSSQLRAWRDKKEKERQKVIHALVNNETYLTIALFRVVVALICFAISIVLYSTSPVMLSMAPIKQISTFPIDRGFIIWKILTPFFGAVSSYIGFRTSTRISIVFKAIKQFRINHGLPRLP